MAALIVFKFLVFFLENLKATITQMVLHDAEEVELSFEATGAFVFRIMQFAPAVKLDNIAEEIGVAIEEIFIPFCVEEYVSP